MSDAVYDALLTHTCTIKRVVDGVENDLGLPSQGSFTNIGTNVVCLIQQKKEKQEQDTRGMAEVGNYLGFFKVTQVILENDIVVFSGTDYIVVAIDDAGGQAHHKEVHLSKGEN